MRFANKIAVVTGAAQGIGQKTARDLASEGCLVALTDVKAEQVKKVAESFGDDHERFYHWLHDTEFPGGFYCRTLVYTRDNYNHLTSLVHHDGIDGLSLGLSDPDDH